MPSTSYRRWRTERAIALNEIEQAHAAVGGTGRGRRYATQQLNHAYAVLLASHFQGFCRDLHDECLDHVVTMLTPAALGPVVRRELLRNRQLDQKNAQPGSIGADFGRLGLEFWPSVLARSPRHGRRQAALDLLNNWRNAIAHQDFDPSKLGGSTVLHLATVRRWRAACQRLAGAFDEVMRQHLQIVTGTHPW